MSTIATSYFDSLADPQQREAFLKLDRSLRMKQYLSRCSFSSQHGAIEMQMVTQAMMAESMRVSALTAAAAAVAATSAHNAQVAAAAAQAARVRDFSGERSARSAPGRGQGRGGGGRGDHVQGYQPDRAVDCLRFWWYNECSHGTRCQFVASHHCKICNGAHGTSHHARGLAGNQPVAHP